MRRLGFGWLVRWLSYLATVVLVLVLAGDRGRAAVVPANIYGQDPLEVLELKVRPNVIVVLDTSGSMKWTVKASANGAPGAEAIAGTTNNYYPPMAGDHPRAKLWQAKQVLKQIVTDNSEKVSFLFGQYDQENSIVMTSTAASLASASSNRFVYSTYACAGACPPGVTEAMTNAPKDNGLRESPVMMSNERAILKAVGDSGTRGLQSWQLIFPARIGPPAEPGWNTFYYEETISGTPYTCMAQLANGPGPKGEKFYTRGGKATTAAADIAGSLAADLKAKINLPVAAPLGNCNRPATKNSYDVTYNAATGQFTFTRTGGANSWRPLWQNNANRPNNIRGALNANTSGATTNPAAGAVSYSTGTPFTLLYRPVSAATNNPEAGTSPWTGTTFKNIETVSSTPTTTYTALAQRFWNGEALQVNDSGEVCAMTFPTSRTNPPSFTVQRVTGTNGTCGAPGATAVFRWGGAFYKSANTPCGDFQKRVDLVPCDLAPPAITQVATITPWLDNEFPLDSSGMPHPAPANLVSGGTTTPYTELQDGTWGAATTPPYVAGGLKGWGSTPITSSLREIKDNVFGTSSTTGLWGAGQTGSAELTGAPPYAISPIKNHKNPKEKTIVLFVTDGEDGSCSGQSNNDLAALAAAYQAERLYRPIACKDPGDNVGNIATAGQPSPCSDTNGNGISGPDGGSSVQTFVVGFGGAFGSLGAPRLDWMAWGGSGLLSNTTVYSGLTNSGGRWTPALSGTYDINCGAGSQCQNLNNTLRALRSSCTTCSDAFVAPDAATLARQLQGIIDQGAQDGDFTAAQSITENIFEYVDKAGATGEFDPTNPRTRYRAITPTRFISSFGLPGFTGRVNAYQNDGQDNPNTPQDESSSVLRWSAAEKLLAVVRGGMNSCSATNGAGSGECIFSDLHGGFSISNAKIKRRIYTTSRNGTFLNLASAATDLIAGTANGRVNLWPPESSWSAALGSTGTAEVLLPGSSISLDGILGLPRDTTGTAATDFTTLQSQFRACQGTNLPSGCSNADPMVRMKTARREAREMILAFMAGAEPIPVTTGGIKRSGTSGGASGQRQILYRARSWVLADSQLATMAVVTPPLPSTPDATPYVAEYKQFRDGPYVVDGDPAPDSDTMIRRGFGLRNPDDDGQGTSRPNLKPVMTVVYAPGNDMLHAFRAGPSTSPSSLCDAYATTLNSSYDCGGEELWGFVPFDQLNALALIYRNQPQTRANHVYMLARGIRFSDIFVPEVLTDVDVGGKTIPSLQGVWRRILFFGRGIGGKYVTALDVTAPGPYTATRLNTVGPIPIWNRGNPDSPDGVATNVTNNNTVSDRNAYARMGQTWSIPVVGYMDQANAIYVSPRAGRGRIDHALFMGSGYGDTNAEGSTFFTLDALTGDVVASANVEAVASSFGLTRSLTYDNALVANPAGFNPKAFSVLKTIHPAASTLTRVYIGDVHGRVWKFLTSRPDQAIPVADLGEDQPVGTAASLLGLPPQPDSPVPYVFVTSGADSQVKDGPFRIFGFVDKGGDVSATPDGTSGTRVVNATTTYLPVEPLFERDFDQGDALGGCDYTEEAVFRGTVQPATAFECDDIQADSTGQQQCIGIEGRVFFAGTRLSLPNTKYAPPTPLSCDTTYPCPEVGNPTKTCASQYPCRSQFDSIIYALGAKTGLAAYDMNSGTEDAYRVFRDSRLAAIQMLADPDPDRGGSRFTPDEGQIKGIPKPPPPPGVPPTANTATANVLMTREPGQPPPAVRYGSTVCQQ